MESGYRMTTLIVIAKAPVPGRVKTRLSPPFSAAECAALAEAALADTLETVLGAASSQPILALDGAPGSWLPPGFAVIPQAQGGLDARIAAAFVAACRHARGPAMLIGMDTPQVSPDLLRPGWDGADALVGLAHDGGFWALGFREPAPGMVTQAVRGVPMSRPDTGSLQLARLRARGLRTRLLPMLRDVDTAADAHAVAPLCPHSRFARRLRAVSTLHTGVVSNVAPDGPRCGELVP
jgi:glycosyltransferase A (GT-A) superfamily protein (DUF2064 family)